MTATIKLINLSIISHSYHFSISGEKTNIRYTLSKFQVHGTINYSHKAIYWMSWTFSSVQLLSRVQLCVTPWTAACQASLSIINSQSLLKLMPIGSVMPSDLLILCCPLLPSSIFPNIRVFSNENTQGFPKKRLHQVAKVWELQLNISPSNE